MTPTQQPPTEPRHIAYNRKLCNQVLAATGMRSQYPPVSEQVQVLPLETAKLFPHGYNPTLNTKGWLVYRFHKGLPSTKLARAVIGPDGNVFSNHELIIAGGIVGEDDAKLFTFQGDDYLSWVESDWAQTGIPNACLVKYAKFNNGAPTEFQQPRLPGNDGRSFQKNWVFFEHNDRLMVLYQCHPTHRIYEPLDPTFKTFETHETPGPRWPYGDIRGGAAPLPYDGKLLRFFHSRINHDLGIVPFRYFLGAYLMEPEPPFKVLKVSSKPIIYGSEVGVAKRKNCYHYKPNVVFVSGAIPQGDSFTISVGENDSACILARITPSQLNF